MARRSTSVRVHLGALMLAFAAVGVAFAVGAPLFQAPDEPPHVDMVRYYRTHPFHLPGSDLRIRSGVQQAVDQVGLNQGGPIDWSRAPASRPRYPAFDDYPDAAAPAATCHVGTWTSCQNYHYGHPPTFYLLMSLPDRALHHFSFPTEVLGLRLLCLLLVVPLVPLTYYAARQVWPDSTRLPLAAAALVALFAPLAADAAAVNNDSLMLLLAGCLIAAAARLLREPSPGSVLAVGLATGGGLLVKSQFQALTLAAAAIVAVALVAIPRRQWAGCAVRFFAPVIVGSAWWLRNLIRYHTLGQPGGEILRPARPGPWNHASPVSYFFHHVDDVVGRFWGLYGQTAVETPSAWRTALTLAAIGLLVLGALAWLVRHQRRSGGEPVHHFWALAVIPAVLVVGPVVASFQVYRGNGEAGRGLLGRYMYPGLPVLAIALVAALAALVNLVPVRRPRGAVHAVGLAGAALLCLAAFLRAMHGFYGSRARDLWLDRAKVVSAVPTVAGWLFVLLLVWLAAVTVAGVATVASRKLLSPIRDTLVVPTATGGR